MLSCISRDGAALPQDTPKTPPLSSPPYKSDASPFGQVSRDYTMGLSGNCREIKRYYGKLKPTGFVDEEKRTRQLIPITNRNSNNIVFTFGRDYHGTEGKWEGAT